MQKSLFENENVVEALNPTLLICSVSGSFSSITYKQAVDFLLPRHYSGRKPGITFLLVTLKITNWKQYAPLENLQVTVCVLEFVVKNIAKRYLN